MGELMSKVKKKPFEVWPSQFHVCMKLCNGRVAPAAFLMQLVIRSSKGTLTDKKTGGGWVGLTVEEWHRVTGYSRSQHNEALKKLREWMLVESISRKLLYTDRNARTWLRLSAKVKSAMSDVMKLKVLSEGADLMKSTMSDSSQTEMFVSSDVSDFLKEKKLSPKKANSKENLTITTTAAQSAAGHEQVEESKGQYLSEKHWYMDTMKMLFKDTKKTPEPYSKNNATALREIIEYLEENPGDILDFYDDVEIPTLTIIGSVIGQWPGWFPDFCVARFKAFGLPKPFQLWALRHQAKAIPDFMKWCNFILDFEAEARLADPSISINPFDLLDDLDEYMATSRDNRSDYLKKVVARLVS